MAHQPVNRENETSFLTNFIRDIPPVTRVLVLGCLLLTFGNMVNVLPSELFILDWGGIISNFRIWTPFLSPFHAGTSGFGFLLHLYFMYTYSRQLEANTFFSRSAPYAWMLCICQLCICLLAPVLQFYLAGPAILIAIIHVWGRHAGDLNVKLYGILTIPAKYLSLAFCVIGTVLSGRIDTSNIAGILAGQLYYFLDSVYPRLPQGRTVISVPAWFERSVSYIEDVGGRAVGLAGTARQISGPQGRSAVAPAGNATGARNMGITRPTARHVWGSGKTLGS